MQNLSVVPFCFESNEVRVISKDDELWFVARDVCNILDLSNVGEAIKILDDDELASEILMSGGQRRDMKLVSESGLYTLIFRSNKPQAKPFRRWVTHEVLPSIRKNGSYDLKQKKEVSVNYTHQRDSKAPGGLDIRYTLDLGKVITRPNRTTIELLERLTGIRLADIPLDEAGISDRVEELFLAFVQERCLVGDGYREQAFGLYNAFRGWCKQQGHGDPGPVKRLAHIFGNHFGKVKSNFIYYEGLTLRDDAGRGEVVR